MTSCNCVDDQVYCVMNPKVAIVVNLQVEGLHQWKDCPIQEVAYLKLLHRHMFHIKAVKSVGHLDRDVEIIMFKRKIKRELHTFYDLAFKCCNFEHRSCEMIAQHLVVQFDLVSCEVLEDGENGSIVYGN